MLSPCGNIIIKCCDRRLLDIVNITSCGPTATRFSDDIERRSSQPCGTHVLFLNVFLKQKVGIHHSLLIYNRVTMVYIKKKLAIDKQTALFLSSYFQL